MKDKHILTEPEIIYGAADDKNVLLLIKKVKQGLDYDFFMNIANNSPFNITEWCGFLHLSPRTLQRYKRENKSFDPIYSEKILEVTMLYKLGADVFGNKEKFNTWLETQSVAVGGYKPKELLDTNFGIGLVKDALTRIEHGVLA